MAYTRLLVLFLGVVASTALSVPAGQNRVHAAAAYPTRLDDLLGRHRAILVPPPPEDDEHAVPVLAMSGLANRDRSDPDITTTLHHAIVGEEGIVAEVKMRVTAGKWHRPSGLRLGPGRATEATGQGQGPETIQMSDPFVELR